MKDRTNSGSSMGRRKFLQLSAVALGTVGSVGAGSVAAAAKETSGRSEKKAQRAGKGGFAGTYSGEQLNWVAFPLGGIGAGMMCLEGTGALAQVSLHHRPEVFNEPETFAAICVKGSKNIARVLEGPVPDRKKFGSAGTGNGASGSSFGLPRFREAKFQARFPFGTVALTDPDVPLAVEITGWSPFEPGDPDNACLPVAALEYRFTNQTGRQQEAVFSWNARNFMAVDGGAGAVKATPGGFVLWGAAPKDRGWEEGGFSAAVDDPAVKVNCAWFRGGWFDSITMTWKDVEEGRCSENPPVTGGEPSPGGSLFVPFTLAPGASKTIVLRFAWYVGRSHLHFGKDLAGEGGERGDYKPWYTRRFPDLDGVTSYWAGQYGALRERTKRFSDCFYDSTLPPEVIDAIAANLTILKSPTVLRQADGRLWAWEGCGDNEGCCAGSCTHVWNYAQAVPHLFPSLERTLRETEFGPSQNERGHQQFRSALPIRPIAHDFHAASDGQLGGIMKVYREWRISGDTEWLKRLWPKVQTSLNYCIELWDPGHKGWLEEPHHNTYDIEFWGPDGMCTSFYLGALKAATLMGRALGDDVSTYADLLAKGLVRMENELFDGEYFFQKVEWKNLRAKNPLADRSHFPPEEAARLEQEGPKYQYGRGCLSDGVLGAWMALVCGVGPVIDSKKVASHLKAVHKYNLKQDLTNHPNPQRPSFACGAEGGLLLCTWPKGGELSLPFVYSNEVWTGIEYQVASHLMLMGHVNEGVEVVRTARERYDGRVRNPFDEYECGHWYARAMSSYGLLQGLSGARYDAVEKVLYLTPSLHGDFRCFFSAASGYGTVGVKDGKPFYEPKSGSLEIREIKYEKPG
jgi:uncharacterized protein (DUF608 family)